MGGHRRYRWMVLVGRRVLRVMAMVRDLSGTVDSGNSKLGFVTNFVY